MLLVFVGFIIRLLNAYGLFKTSVCIVAVSLLFIYGRYVCEYVEGAEEVF